MLSPVEIGKRIRDRRMELELTLQDVADRVGVQNSTIYRYERGEIKRVKMPVIEAIASALQIPTGYLLGHCDKARKINAKECADILRSFIQHRKHMNQNLYTAELTGHPVKIVPNDRFLEAVEFALVCVEETIQK